ncbi:hypothetical protein AKJ16_DCAP11560 [Drosera capensis]
MKYIKPLSPHHSLLLFLSLPTLYHKNELLGFQVLDICPKIAVSSAADSLAAGVILHRFRPLTRWFSALNCVDSASGFWD